MRTRVPSHDDFKSLPPPLHVSLVFPEVPETTTAILVLFHGLGDSDESFSRFAKNLNLPGVLAISVRGISPLPPAMLGLPNNNPTEQTRNFHWGDDLTLSPSTGDLDPDPGFSKAEELVLKGLVYGVLVEKCGWDTRDILFFGFGQGGSVALGLASRLRQMERIVDITDERQAGSQCFKGVISIGGPLPPSMVPTISARDKARTPVLACHGRCSDALDEDSIGYMRKEFVDVREVKWKKADDSMPGSREEMLPIMQFIAERLRPVTEELEPKCHREANSRTALLFP